MRGIKFKYAVMAMSGSVFFLVLVLCQPYRSFAQTSSPVAQSQRTSSVVPNRDAASKLGVPKPTVAPPPGTWNYRTQAGIGEQPKLNSAGTYSTSVKDDGGAWTVTVALKFPGAVTDVWTLDKGTLILRKESFKHFVHPDQRWKAVAISLDFQERLGQLKIIGAERVTVPAGTYDSYKVELTANDDTGDKETAWIAKDSRMPVKVDAVDKLYGIIRAEMVP